MVEVVTFCILKDRAFVKMLTLPLNLFTNTRTKQIRK